MFPSKPIELFYLFFEGILLFQVIFFGMVYFITRRKDVLYYSLLNLVAAAYFFLNAPDTFLGINEDIVFNSPAYLYVNFAVFLGISFIYLLFLKDIFSDTLEQYAYFKKVYTATFYSIPLLYLSFVLLGALGCKTNAIFYAGHIVNGPFCTILFILNFRAKGYKSLIIYGMMVVFLSAAVTILLTMRYNAGDNDTILDKYPLLIIKVGMLLDIIFFQLALLKRWSEQEKELAVEKLQSLLTVEKLRNKISGELHDDIGSTLSGIAMYSHMADTHLQNDNYEKAKDSVNVIQRSTNEIVDKLSDLVWAINPSKDSFATMLERIQQYGEAMCRAKNIHFACTLENIDLIKEPGMEVRQHLYLFAKEAINNAVKYSGAEAVKFEASVLNDILKMSIKDNGNGFDIEKVSKGNGLDNMQKRAGAIAAVYSVASGSVNGTQVELALKITH